MNTDPTPVHDPGEDEAVALATVVRTLRTHRVGTLHFDDHFIPTPFITDPGSGRLILAVPEACFFAHEHIFFIPEEAEDALQLLLSPERAEESALTDRWMAYHGEPEHVRWAECYIDAAKRTPWVFDGDAMMLPNAIAGDESRLVRIMNADKSALARVASDAVSKDVPDPVGVGVDEDGAYVRARFGVVRLHFRERAADAGEAESLLRELLAGGAS